MKRLILLLVALSALIALGAPAAALADGDPGSDVLYFQPLFVGADDNVSTAQQLQLGKVLTATTALHAQVRVAIIGKRDDLGTVTGFFGNPVGYANYLGSELQLEYGGRVVVVMPQGTAVYWHGHEVKALDGIRSGASPTQLVNAALAAVTQVEASAGISAGTLQRTAGSASALSSAVAAARGAPSAALASTDVTTHTATSSDVSPWVIGVGLVVVLGAVFWAPPLWRRRRVVFAGGIAVPGVALGVGALAALIVLAVVIHTGKSSTASADALATNPYIGGVTSLGDTKMAPDISLTDETGHQVSLKQYRGKTVILSFTDDECQTICPLTTQAMVDARASLGTAAKNVQLLAVNANPKSNSVYDVLTYSELHGMLGQWHFLTGSLPQLKRVWDAYHVADDLSTDTNIIDHTPALYIIGPNGKMRYSSLTYSNYAAIPQYGQELAQAVSETLPSHPKVQTKYSYRTIQGISASTQTTLPKVGGGTVTVGSGGPHLYLFFATWDQQSTALKGQMEKLNAYATYAKAHGLPPVTAIDEASVEPNPSAVSRFLAGMHLDYPVAIDRTGQLADGYGVQGEPWFVLGVPRATNTLANPTATTPWQQEVYTQGWPTLNTLKTTIPAALRPATRAQSQARITKELAGSPPVLSALHAQANQLLPGGAAGLTRRIKALKGHPVVVNIWASDCAPCQAEADYFGVESAKWGKKVGFLGVDYEDTSTASARGFLARKPVSYPSYTVEAGLIPTSLVKSGIEGTPTTVYIDAAGKVTYIQSAALSSQQQLDQQIQTYALRR